MKLTLRFTLCLTLVLTLLFTCAVSPMALSDEMTHVYDSGTFWYLNAYYSYSTDSAASYTSAKASISFGRAATLTAYVKAHIQWDDEMLFNESSDGIHGMSVQATVNDIVDCGDYSVDGTIIGAYCKYVIGTQTELTYNVN